MYRNTSLSRLRSVATGERHQTASRAVRRLVYPAPLIAQASDGQARLESLFLANLDRLDRVWHRADPPFVIRRCAPAVEDIIVEIARPHLSAVLAESLPCVIPGQDLHGVPGLRVRHCGGHLVLEHLRLAGRIRIPLSGVQWRKTRSWLSGGLGTPGTVVAWAEHPQGLMKDEEKSLSWQTQAQAGLGAGEAAQLISAVLRRLQLLRGPVVPGCLPFWNVWSNSIARNDSGARLWNVEWGSRPTALELAKLLTDARSLLALPESLRAHIQIHQGDEPWVRVHTEHDSQLLLRHNPLQSVLGRAEAPTDGPYRPPRGPARGLDDASALDLVVGALTQDAAVVERRDLHVVRRAGGGWDVHAPGGHYQLLRRLREAAHSCAFPHLWAKDVEDILSLRDQRSIVRVRGVEFVFHDA